jgi:hypothetical protein
MAAQALDRQDSRVADRLAMVFDYFSWGGERGCWPLHFRPGVCGNFLVDRDKVLVWCLFYTLVLVFGTAVDMHVMPDVYSGVYYNMDIWTARMVCNGFKRRCSLYTAVL